MSAEFAEPSDLSEEEMDRLSRIGRAIYDEKLKDTLEPDHHGQVVAIHLDSGDYEVAERSSKAHFALRARHPTGMIMVTDVGPAEYDGLTIRMLAGQLLAGQRK